MGVCLESDWSVKISVGDIKQNICLFQLEEHGKLDCEQGKQTQRYSKPVKKGTLKEIAGV